jgi:hypothetical protein
VLSRLATEVAKESEGKASSLLGQLMIDDGRLYAERELGMLRAEFFLVGITANAERHVAY